VSTAEVPFIAISLLAIGLLMKSQATNQTELVELRS